VPAKKLLDRVRDALRLRTARREPRRATSDGFAVSSCFNDKRHPREMGAAEIERFLTSLAVDRR